MGQIAARNNSEYNPYLPVGPVRTYSLDYRTGYAAGYSAGYEEYQEQHHIGIYADDEATDYEEVYYEEDY